MDFDIIYKIIMLLAGLGLVIYGIKVINTGMINLLGPKFQTMLAKNSKNKFKSFLMGAGTTVVLQSSTVTNVMVNGFLSVGTMGLKQAMAIGIGSAFGGAVAMLLLMFESISVLKLFCVFVLIGAFVFVFAKKAKTKNLALFLLGFGILCLGVSLMSFGVEGLMTVVDMSSFFATISNPILMILLGMILCMISQSAYPVVAILIPLVNAGLISFDMACFAVLGVNIGSGVAISIIISALESGENSKRFLIFNLLTKVFACVVISILLLIPNWANAVHQSFNGEASLSLVLFNLFNNTFPVLFLPFVGFFAKMFEKRIKFPASKNSDYASFEIEERVVQNPAVALEKTRQNCLKILELNRDFGEKCFNNLFEQTSNENLRSNAKLIERVIKISTNNAIRLGGIYDKNYVEKLKLFVDILSSERQILRACLEIVELSTQLEKQKDALSKKQKDTIKKLVDDISDMNLIVFAVCEGQDKTESEKNLEVVFKMHEQNEKNISKAKQDCLYKKSKSQKDDTLFFALIYQFDQIENEICDIAIKTALLED